MNEIRTIPKNHTNILGWMCGAESENYRDEEVIYTATFKMNTIKNKFKYEIVNCSIPLPFLVKWLLL